MDTNVKIKDISSMFNILLKKVSIVLAFLISTEMLFQIKAPK